MSHLYIEKIINDPIINISRYKLMRDPPQFERNTFYIGNELQIEDEDDIIKLHRFDIDFLKDYVFTPPELADDEEPYIYLPYQEKFNDHLDKFAREFTIYNSFYNYDFLNSFYNLMYNQVIKWNQKYHNFIVEQDRFFFNLKSSEYKPISTITYNIYEKYPGIDLNEIRKILSSSRSGENIIVKIHMAVKPEYIFYVCEMLIKHYDKFLFDDNLSDEQITKIKEIIPNFRTEIPEILNMKGSYLDNFKLVPNFNLSNFSPAFKKAYNILPTFVFYPNFSTYSTKIVNILKEIFNERVTNIIHIDKAPRYNLRINKMIYIGYGNGDHKPGTKLLYGRETDYDQPEEYYRLEEKCKTKLNKEDCLKINEFSQKYSDNDICSFDEQDGMCKISKNENRYNLVIHGSSFTSLKKIYNEIEPKPAKIEDYEQKYIKYKMKYLALRKQLSFNI